MYHGKPVDPAWKNENERRPSIPFPYSYPVYELMTRKDPLVLTSEVGEQEWRLV